jgi:hypothetical protein
MGVLNPLICLSLILVSTGHNLSERREGAVYGVEGNRASSPTAPLSRIQKLWEEQFERLNKRSKDYPSAKVKLLVGLLKQATREEVDGEFARCITLQPGGEQLSEYERTLAQAFAVLLLEQNDREKLLNLLSFNPPRFVAVMPLELFLATNLKDGVLVLFDSYGAARNPDAKKTLFEALRRAFKAQHRVFKIETVFLDQSRKWYLKNKGRIKINPLYNPYSISPSYRELFVHKKSYIYKSS